MHHHTRSIPVSFLLGALFDTPHPGPRPHPLPPLLSFNTVNILQAVCNQQSEALRRETQLRVAAEARAQMLELEREEDHVEFESAVTAMVGREAAHLRSTLCLKRLISSSHSCNYSRGSEPRQSANRYLFIMSKTNAFMSNDCLYVCLYE